MGNLLESLFLCYDNSPYYWEIAGCGNRTTFFAWRNNRTVVKSSFYGCVTIELLSKKIKIVKMD